MIIFSSVNDDQNKDSSAQMRVAMKMNRGLMGEMMVESGYAKYRSNNREVNNQSLTNAIHVAKQEWTGFAIKGRLVHEVDIVYIVYL